MTKIDDSDAEELKYFKLVELRWHHVENAYIVTLWVLMAAAAKIIFHMNKKCGTYLPDSACLMILGLVMGFILVPLNIDPKLYDLRPDYFFLYLLPPIIFDAGYFMPIRQLFRNFRSIMVFAFIGTIFNTAAIGGTLYACERYGFFKNGITFNFYEILLFSALISAVDPVAVLAVFEELHINEFLFINVFGEALFNDGAAVVLYNIFKQYIEIKNLKFDDYLYSALSALLIIFGGLIIGLIFGILISLITTYDRHIKYLAPLFIFTISYLSYLTAEIFGISSIFALVICGMSMKQYVKENITPEANATVKYFTKLLSQSSEAVIFIFLGISAAVKVKTHEIHWNTAFVGITILACIFYRTMGIIIQCSILNRFNTKKFSFSDQFVLSFGGLRGAIAFGLVSSISNKIEAKSLFVTTTMVVIFFTVFVQGISIKPILSCLNVKTAIRSDKILTENTFDQYFGHTMSGIESLAGQKGWNFIRQWYERLNARVFKPWLIKSYSKQSHDASQIIRAYNKITLQEAMDMLRHGPVSPRLTSPVQIQIPSNTPAVYSLFNQLLNQKIHDLSPHPGDINDAPDDYIGISLRSNSSSTSLSSGNSQYQSNLRNHFYQGSLKF